MKKSLTLLCSFISILCLCYYSSKYYLNESLFISKDNIWFFTIIISFALFGLVMGVINCYKVDKLKEQIEELSKKIDSYHYSEMKSIHSNMEAILDGGKNNELL